MPSRITLMLLASAPLVVGYLAWRYQRPRGVTTHDQHQATKRQGERPMTSEMAGTAQEQVLRWMEEGPTALAAIRCIVHEDTNLKRIAEATLKECERLRHEGDQLRAEVSRLTAETERLQKERADTAQWFTAMIKEAVPRFRIEPPPA